MQYTDNLESERLVTRFLRQEDVPVWAEFLADPIASTFNPSLLNESPVERAQKWIDFTQLRYSENRLGLQALISKETGELVGQCGLIVQELNGKNEVEIGYHLFRRHWGKGYAREAARMFRDYGFVHGFADSMISIIHPLNFLSKKVAEANGMRLTERSATFRGGEYDVFRIERADWLSLQQ
jgi:ribosomal-protein-alanine N-acetyltransferase